MAIFTLYHFRIDIMNWYNTGGKFAEGLSPNYKTVTYTMMTKLRHYGGDGINARTFLEWNGKECAGGKIEWYSASEHTTCAGQHLN